MILLKKKQKTKALNSHLYIYMVTTLYRCRLLAHLQKQNSCFNQKLTSLVADYLERWWLGELCFFVL